MTQKCFYLKLITVSMAVLMSSGCESMAGKTNQAADTRACVKNFTVEGSMFALSGTAYSTSMFVDKTSKKTAVDRAAKAIALDGWTITTIDRDSGLIAASVSVINGQGSTAPFVTSIETENNGVRVLLKSKTAFGQTSRESDVKDGFCRIISAVEKR